MEWEAVAYSQPAADSTQAGWRLASYTPAAAWSVSSAPGRQQHTQLANPSLCVPSCAHLLSLFLQVGPKAFPRVAMDLATTVERIQQNFVICDPSLPDCPIVFASDAFLELTGYPREEVLGRNCRFLQVGLCLFAWGVRAAVGLLVQATATGSRFERGSGCSCRCGDWLA